MRVIGLFVLTILVILLLGFGFTYFDFQTQSFFAPRREQLRNTTFHQSQAYTDGMKSQLAKAKYQFTVAKTDAEKAAICALVRTDYGSIDASQLPLDLAAFIATCNNFGG